FARSVGTLLLAIEIVGFSGLNSQAQEAVNVQLVSTESGTLTLAVGDEQVTLEAVTGRRGYHLTPMPQQIDLRHALVRVKRLNARIAGSVQTDPKGSWLVFDTVDGRLPRLL